MPIRFIAELLGRQICLASDLCTTALDRVAFLAPDPIPNSLIDVAVPGEAPDYDAYEARAGLYAYSLATQAKGEDGAAKGFVVHRLVHDFARRAMTAERRGEALREALEWINPAFVGDPWDVRTWPVLDPLAPHALAVAHRADEIGIAEPTAQLFGTTGLLFHAKARYAEAEPLLPRAMAPLGGILPPELRGKSHANIRLVPGRIAEAAPARRRRRGGRHSRRRLRLGRVDAWKLREDVGG